MEHQNEWVSFKDIEWNDSKFNRFHVDTRDFCCGYNFSNENHPDWSTINKYDKFFMSELDLVELIDRLYTESGGEGEWRMLCLESNDSRVLNWRLKYLRIWRTEKGFLVCNSSNEAIPKDLLSLPVEKKYLNHIDRNGN